MSAHWVILSKYLSLSESYFPCRQICPNPPLLRHLGALLLVVMRTRVLWVHYVWLAWLDNVYPTYTAAYG